MQKDKPIYFYVANLGSEVHRLLNWKEKGDKTAMKNAYQRSLEIIQTIKSFNNASANAEMDILRDCLKDYVSENSEQLIDRNQISSYFNPFALRITNNLFQ